MWAENQNYVFQNWGEFRKISKGYRKMSFWIRKKSALFGAFSEKKISALSERIRAETTLFSADFWLWKFTFSALFRAFQVMNSAESKLKHIWFKVD